MKEAIMKTRGDSSEMQKNQRRRKEMNKIASAFVPVIVSTFLLSATSATAQQQFVYPQKGQSAEQQKKDEYECHSWAVKQTGFDPAAVQAPAQQPAQQPAGAQPGSGARGAARGAEPAQRSAPRRRGGKGRRGRSRGGNRGRPGAEPQAGAAATASAQQQASSQQSAKQQNYLKARGACLEGKGYSVK
jgi:hypothetical protein